MKNNPKIHTKNLIINMLKYRLYWIFTELINVMMKISGWKFTREYDQGFYEFLKQQEHAMYQLSEPIATCWTTVPLAGHGIFELTQYDQSLFEVALEIHAFSWYKKL